MNSTAPHPRTPGVPILKPTPGAVYPKRVTDTPEGTKAIILGATPQDVTSAQRWVYQQWRNMGCPDMKACDAASVAVALVSNAHQHTASGLPGGETVLAIRHGVFLSTIRVSDQGPRPDNTDRPKLPSLRPDRQGLRLVELVAAYWDWETTASGAVTVRAALEMP
ncbi:ATP-binding protein [Nocardiopsis terrae]|uniref:ATP-binding protein n=1 Tax=Streptomyces sp. NPDC057554 TaxID=3350538 RepID=UPI0036802168